MIDFQKPKAIDKEIILIQDKVVMTKMDKEGILEFANEYFVEVTGYEEYELMGKSVFCIQHPDMPNVLFKWMWEKLDKKENFNFPVKSLAKNGKYFWSITDFSFKVNNQNETEAIFNRRKFASREVVSYFDNLYSKIKSVEVESGIALAEKYLIGHLEEREMTIKEIVYDLDSDISIKQMVSQPKTISKIAVDNHPVFEKKPNPIEVKIPPKVEVPKSTSTKTIIDERPEEELTIQERIDRIREKANRVSSKSISSPKPINEIVSKPKEEVKKEVVEKDSKTTKGKKSLFQKLFGKTDEEIEEERRRNS